MLKYVPIRVSTLRGDAKIPFNAYVQVAGKYILLCREGDSFEGTRLDRLKGKKIIKMYVPEDQEGDYARYISENILHAYESNKKPIDVRAQIIHGALQAVTENLIEEPDNQDLYRIALEGSKRFAKFIHLEPQALKPILDLKNSDYSVAHHGVVVSALALSIAEEMGLKEARPMQMETLSVGCMIHDLEHSYNNIDLSIPPDKLEGAEKRIYEEHGAAGFDRVKNHKFYDSLILDVIQFHEEKIDGSGPLKRREKETDVLVLVVAAANAFDHYSVYNGMAPKEALKRMLIDKMGLIQLDAMKALQAALKKRGLI